MSPKIDAPCLWIRPWDLPPFNLAYGLLYITMDRLYIPVIILHLPIVAKNVLLQRSHNYGVWNCWQQKLLYCICYTIWIDWHMIFGLQQEGGSLIAPMALVHPLHPIDNRSRNSRRNLWVGWRVSSWWPLFPTGSSVLIYIYTYMYIFYMSSLIGRINTYDRSVIQYWWSCTSHSIGLYFWGVRNSSVECHFLLFLFTICVLLTDYSSLIPGCLWLLVFRPWARGVNHAPPPPPPPPPPPHTHTHSPTKLRFSETLRVSTIRNKMLTVKS